MPSLKKLSTLCMGEVTAIPEYILVVVSYQTSGTGELGD